MSTDEDEGCPFCGSNEVHSHIISDAVSQGHHSTYEELLAEVERYENTPPTFAELSNLQDENEDLAKENTRIHKVKDMVLRERQTMETRIKEMKKGVAVVLRDLEKAKEWNSVKTEAFSQSASFMDTVLIGAIAYLKVVLE